VHARPAHLLERDLLAGGHLAHARRPQVGGGRALHHDRQVAQRGHVGRSRRRWPEHAADLRHPPREPHLVVEDVAPGVAPGVALELLVDPRPRRVDQVDQRRADLAGDLLHAGDLVEGPPAPGARLDRVVVGDHAHRAAAELADGGHHRVGGQALLRAGQQPVLELRLGVQQQLEPVPDQQLAGLHVAAAVLLGAAQARRLQPRGQLRVDVALPRGFHRRTPWGSPDPAGLNCPAPSAAGRWPWPCRSGRGAASGWRHRRAPAGRPR
jgi:hypothetical protein